MTERTLLLVDDEETILRALTRLFRRDGYTTMTATSGQQGLELLQQHEVGVLILSLGWDYVGRIRGGRCCVKTRNATGITSKTSISWPPPLRGNNH